jgi:arylsulfatase A-like enzyme
MNVVLVTFDTTRADHIGCYGDDSASTPSVDDLAAHGVLFRSAYAPIPITLPAHTSMMTGETPLSHGVRDNGLFVVSDRDVTLAEILSANGYACAAAVGSFPLIAKFGLNQGFEFYNDDVRAQWEDYLGRQVRFKQELYFDERKAARVNEAVLPWLSKHRDQPFFLWVHYFDPHAPLDPPPTTSCSQLALRRRDRYADECLGILLDELRRLGVYD